MRFIRKSVVEWLNTLVSDSENNDSDKEGDLRDQGVMVM